MRGISKEQSKQGTSVGIPIAWYKARISGFPPKIDKGKEQVVFSGGGHKVPKLSLALEQEIILGHSGP